MKARQTLVEAFQWGADLEPDWFTEGIKTDVISSAEYPGRGTCLKIKNETDSLTSVAFLKDYIVRYPDGRIYPCEPEVFQQNHYKKGIPGKTCMYVRKTYGWIPVFEALPKQYNGESEEVLCFCSHGCQRVGFMCEDEWLSAETGFPFSYHVVAWKPLQKEYNGIKVNELFRGGLIGLMKYV